MRNRIAQVVAESRPGEDSKLIDALMTLLSPELEKAERYWEIREIVMRGMPRLAELEQKARRYDELDAELRLGRCPTCGRKVED